jgi:hypothetical protein
MFRKYFRLSLVLFPLILSIISCTPNQDPVQTAIAQTQSAQNTAVFQSQKDTMMAMANMQSTLSVSGKSQEQTQAAMEQTRVAMEQTQQAINQQQQIQLAIGQTQAAIAAQPVPVAPEDIQLTPSVEAMATPGPDTTEEPGGIPAGINPMSSTGIDFTGARIYTHGGMGTSNQYLITIQLPEKVKQITGNYHLEVAAKKFKCDVKQDYPNRLYCYGVNPRGGFHYVSLYEDVGERIASLIFQSEITLPYWTPTWMRYPYRTSTPL